MKTEKHGERANRGSKLNPPKKQKSCAKNVLNQMKNSKELDLDIVKKKREKKMIFKNNDRKEEMKGER